MYQDVGISEQQKVKKQGRDNHIQQLSTRSKKFSPKNKKDLGMACHTPPLKKAKKHGEMPLPSLGPIPLKKGRI